MTINHQDDMLQEGPAAMMVRALVRMGFVVALIIVLALAGCAGLPFGVQRPASGASQAVIASSPQGVALAPHAQVAERRL